MCGRGASNCIIVVSHGSVLGLLAGAYSRVQYGCAALVVSMVAGRQRAKC